MADSRLVNVQTSTQGGGWTVTYPDGQTIKHVIARSVHEAVEMGKLTPEYSQCEQNRDEVMPGGFCRHCLRTTR